MTRYVHKQYKSRSGYRAALKRWGRAVVYHYATALGWTVCARVEEVSRG